VRVPRRGVVPAPARSLLLARWEARREASAPFASNTRSGSPRTRPQLREEGTRLPPRPAPRLPRLPQRPAPRLPPRLAPCMARAHRTSVRLGGTRRGDAIRARVRAAARALEMLPRSRMCADAEVFDGKPSPEDLRMHQGAEAGAFALNTLRDRWKCAEAGRGVWIGSFDPERFDRVGVNTLLAKYCRPTSKSTRRRSAREP